MLKVSILDGYVDEPTCLGVPPYISPYPRYIAGAVWTGEPKATVSYVTIDQLRTNKSLLTVLSESHVLIVIAGMAVPGRYLAGFPASPNELVSLLSPMTHPVKLLCGPAAKHGFGLSGGKKIRDLSSVEHVFDLVVPGDGEIVVSDLVTNNLAVDTVDPAACRPHPGIIREFAMTGSKIVTHHPFFPEYLITEIETYRGCPRSIVGGCSFCSEPSKGPPAFRPIKDIHAEIQALYTTGIRHFRLGNQPCIFSYMAHDAGKAEFPQPNPEALETLFKGIRTVAPELQTLHIDNANPGMLARYPEECTRIAQSIIKYHTPGDVAAFGVESVDPIVIQKNNLKATPDEVLQAIQLLNDVGSTRGSNGLPELLPGLNFVFGLDGETTTTFDLDYQFLQTIYTKGLLLRRINLRQVIPIPGTRMLTIGTKLVKKHKHNIRRFKRLVQEHVERPMLEKLVPKGTVLRDVYTELYRGKTTFGRQLGSYPLLVGIPGVYPLHRFVAVKLVSHGYRSVTAVPYPVAINTVPRETLEALPEVGKKRAIRILAQRPYADTDHFVRSLDNPEVGEKLRDYITVHQ